MAKQVILAVVAHSDDETLGAGGALARHVQDGDKVYALSMTDGVGARGNSVDARKSRQEAAEAAAKILGFRWLEGSDFPDNAMDTVALLDIIKAVEAAKQQTNPTIIYTHHPADLNIDHRTVCQAVLTAFRPQPKEIWQEIRSFEVPSATDFGHEAVTAAFMPNLFIDITQSRTQKLVALRQYGGEIRDYPHSRSLQAVDNLAEYRGSQVGLEAAEAFQILRKIQR